jgi:hypothetical protein
VGHLAAGAGLIISSNKVLRPIRGFCSCIPMHITEFFRRGAEMVMCRLRCRSARPPIEFKSVWIARETNHNALKLSGSAHRFRLAGVAFNL